MDLSVKLRKYRLLLIVPLICFKSFSQSIVTDFKSGSLIIPMDNAKQGLASGVAFNVKVYGLVNLLLQNNIPVNWIIKDPKVKDESDFSVLSARISPSATAASVLSYSAGPFIVDSLWAAKAAPIISAYGNSVAVYTAQASFQAPVRYQLTFKPKIAVFTNGGSPLIHTKALRLAGFTSPAHFDSIPAQNIDDAGVCYTFASEPHWVSGQSGTVTSQVTSFVLSGGNFLAQCAGVDAYENLEHHHTTNGVIYETTNGNKDNANLYPVTTHPLTQFDGELTNAPTGTVVNFKNNGGSYQPSTEFLIKKNPLPAMGVADGDVVLSSRKIGSTATGGIVSYFGGHDYLRSTFDLLDLGILGLEFARANDVTWNNGLRIYYNALFMPPERPTSCNFVFAADVVVTSGVDNQQPCIGGTVNYTVSIANNGPGTANNVLVRVNPPAGVTYNSAAPQQGTYNNGTGTWTVGAIAPGSTLNLVLTYTIPTAGSFTFTSYNADLIATNSFLNDTTTLSFQTDFTPPSVTAPANIVTGTNAGCTATGVALGTPITSDNCGVTSVTNNAPSAFPPGVTTVTWTVTDNAGLTATAQQTVTVTDTQNPTITAPATINAATNSGCTATGVLLGTPTTSDNCGVASVTHNAPAVFPVGSMIVTWTVTDNAGNTATAQQTVNVADTQNPVITAPANVNTTTNSGCTATGVALGAPATSDNCTVASVTNNAPTAFPSGTTTVTWTVTDNSGNTATAQQTVTVTDSEDPTIAAPADVTVSANASCETTGVALGTPTTSDNCGVASVVNNAPSVFALGTTTVTWTVTDDSGNTATATQSVTVVDDELPTITSPGNTILYTNAGCAASGPIGTPLAADNCGLASVTNDAPAIFPLGLTVVTWTAIDNSGNTTTATQDITVVDGTAPTIAAPPGIAIPTNDGCTATGIALGTPTTADNCGVASVTNDAPAVFPIGTTTVTWTVTDNAGNTETATQAITVSDEEAPVITAPADIATTPDSGCDAENVDLGTPTTADNCGVASVTNDAPSEFAAGATVVTWIVTDNSGNTATAVQTVTVTDDEAPVITAPVNIAAFTNSGCEATGIALGTPTTADNCGVASVTNNAPTAFPLGTTTVTWTVTDNAGNMTTALQTVTISDMEAPAIANCGDTIVSCVAEVIFDAPQASDNCSVATFVQSDQTGLQSGSSFPAGYTTLEYTAMDGSGNVTVCTKTIRVIVVTATPDAGEDQTVFLPEAQLSASVNGSATGMWEVLSGTATLQDPAAAVTMVYGLAKGTNVLTWTVSEEGCKGLSDTLLITYLGLAVPNGFSPDGDNVNDRFEIAGLEYFSPVSLTVLNRWGTPVYESADYSNDWDGTNAGGQPLSDDTYYYKMTLNDHTELTGFLLLERK